MKSLNACQLFGDSAVLPTGPGIEKVSHSRPPRPSPATMHKEFYSSSDQRSSLIPQSRCQHWPPEAVQVKAGNRKRQLWSPAPSPPKTITTAFSPVLPVESAPASWVPTVLATHTSCHSPLLCRKQREDYILPFSSKLQNILHHLGSPLQSSGRGCGPVRE